MHFKKCFYLFLFSTVFLENAYANNCLTCGFITSVESSRPSAANICDSLYNAACISLDGKSKFEGRTEKLNHELSQIVIDGREISAKAMGFKSVKDALLSKLKENNIEISQSFLNSTILSQGNLLSLSGKEPEAFPQVAQCKKDSDDISRNYDEISDISKLKQIAQQKENIENRYKKIMIGFKAQDIPLFMQDDLQSICGANQSVKAVRVCGNPIQIKQDAIAIFRMQGTPEYKKKAEAFVQKFMDLNDKSSGVAEQTENWDAEKWKEKIRSFHRVDCYTYGQAVRNQANLVVMQTFAEINKSKPTIDFIIDNFYTPERKKLADKIFNESRSDIQEIVGKLVRNPQKKSQIVDSYDNLKMIWMEKPKDSYYTKGRNGVLILDDKKAPPILAGVGLERYDAFSIFSDNGLSVFTNLNADYVPKVQVGREKFDARVYMYPPQALFLDSNPNAFLETIAHESGHNIGPEVSKVNGYDLNPEYRSLLACYQSSRSIHLQAGQQDEVIADYISSEVMARELSKMPAEKARQALMSSMEDLCIVDEGSKFVSFSEHHPEKSLRMDGIFGANPHLRQAIGCNSDEPNFKSCSVSGLAVSSILDKKLPDRYSGKKGEGAQ